MKLTRHKIVDLNKALSTLRHLSGVRFAYAVAKNINRTTSELESLQAANEPSESFLLYEQERIALAKKHARMIDGQPQTFTNEAGQTAYVVESQGLFDDEFKALKERYQPVIDEREKQNKDLEALLKEEVEIDLHKIPFIDIPQNITTEQMTGIYILIEEPPQG